MAIDKICGIETEYGIVVRGDDAANPIAASSLLINAYLSTLSDGKVAWDFKDETPGQDARGNSLRYTAAPEVETHLVNAVLTNGARFYVDHAHPEYSSPECIDARQAMIYDRAGEGILLAAMKAASAVLPPDQEIVVYKNNSDGKGNSYGCHENYLVGRSTPFPAIVEAASLHLVTRQIFTGSGKVGTELPGRPRSAVEFQLTQRADFFEEPVGLETTLKRPVINTRDEPHADPAKYRRLHVITGDANMSETATLLKLGTTCFVLAMLEDGMLADLAPLADPVRAMHAVSLDLSLTRPLDLADGSTITALELQGELLRLAQAWADRHGMDAVGLQAGELVLSLWEDVLARLESNPLGLANQLDWVAKFRLFDAYRDRHGLVWSDARLAAMDLQYHDLRPETSLARRVGLATIADSTEVDWAVENPPEDTRAYFRGRCLSRFSDQVVAANWDSMVFDTGGDSLQRIPMMEPGRGTKTHIGGVVDTAPSAAAMIEMIGQA